MYEKRDFTIDPETFGGLPEYVDQLKAEGTNFVIILVGGMNIFAKSIHFLLKLGYL